jgi:hypothetical protein
MLSSIFDTIRDPDISGWEKFTTILTTLSMLIPTLVNAMSGWSKIINKETLAKIKNVFVTKE